MIKKSKTDPVKTYKKQIDLFNEKDYFQNCYSQTSLEIKKEIKMINSMSVSEKRNYLTKHKLEIIFDRIDKLGLVERNVLSLPIVGFLYYVNDDEFNKYLNKTDKSVLFYSLSLSLLSNSKVLSENKIKKKQSWVFYNDISKKNEALQFLKTNLVDLLLILPDRDMADYNSLNEEVLILTDFFIKIEEVSILVDAANDAKHIFEPKKETNVFLNPISGIVFPRDVCFSIYEDICQKLLDNGNIKEALSVAEFMQEKNKIARVYIKKLAIINSRDSLSFIPKIIKLIESSEKIPIDHNFYSDGLSWPERGYSLLALANYYSGINDINNCKKNIYKALEEINLEVNNIKIEPLNNDFEYRMRFNQLSLDNFKLACVNEFLKINCIEEVINLSNTIDVKSGYNTDYSSNQNFKYNSLTYYNSRKNISKYLYEQKKIDKSITFILDDNNIPIIGKIISLDEVLKDLNYKDFFLFKHYFNHEKILPFFVNMLLNKIEFSTTSFDEFAYLSKYGTGIFNGLYNNNLNQDVFMSYVKTKAKEIANSKDQIKINIISKIFNIVDE